MLSPEELQQKAIEIISTLIVTDAKFAELDVPQDPDDLVDLCAFLATYGAWLTKAYADLNKPDGARIEDRDVEKWACDFVARAIPQLQVGVLRDIEIPDDLSGFEA